MVLTDRQILWAIDDRQFRIEPFDPDVYLQPTSIDLRLGALLLIPQPDVVHLERESIPVQAHTKSALATYMLMPNKSVLGATLEYVTMGPQMVGIVSGKSSLARLFLQIECAGYVDPGFEGNLTIEMTNLGPYTIVLQAGMTICQLRLEALSERPFRLYGSPELGSHYQESVGPVPAEFTPRNLSMQKRRLRSLAAETRPDAD